MEEQAVAIANATVKICEAYMDALEKNKRLRECLDIFFDRFIHVEDNCGYWDHDKQIRVIPINTVDKWIEEFQDAIKEY